MTPKRISSLLFRASALTAAAGLVLTWSLVARAEGPVVAVVGAAAADLGCPVDFAEIPKPGPSATMMALTQQREDLLRHYFPQGNTHKLHDGSDLFVPAVSPEERERLGSAVNDLLNREVKQGLRPKKTVEEFRKWLGENPFPTPGEIAPGATLGQYADALVLKSIVETHQDPKSLMEALRGNLAAAPMKAVRLALSGGKKLAYASVSVFVVGTAYKLIGDVNGAYLSTLEDPITDYLGKRAAEQLAGPQQIEQNFLTGNSSGDDEEEDGSKDSKPGAQKDGKDEGKDEGKDDGKDDGSDDGDDDSTDAVTQKAVAEAATPKDKKQLKAAKPELAQLSKMVKALKSQGLTDNERAKLWKQFGARFYKLNFKLSKTLQDNVSSGRGAFDGSVLGAPIGFAVNIATFENNYDMHRRNVAELQAQLAAFNPKKNKGDTPERKKELEQDLADHKSGLDRAKKDVAQVLAAWEIHRFMFPETSDSTKQEAAGEEGFSSSFDTVSHQVGIDELATRYKDEVAAALNSYDSRLKLLQKLAYGKLTDPTVK